MLQKLLQRGDYVAIEHGRLVIAPKSDKPIPKAWIKQNQTALIVEIAKLIDVDVFAYRSYATGRYGEHKAESLRLDYVSLVTGTKCAAIFNVMLARERNRGNHKAGDPLPDKQFRTTEHHGFVSLWKRLGIELPRSLTEWHDHMGKLKTVFVSASVIKNSKHDKLANESIEPLSIGLSDIQNLIGKRAVTLIGEKTPDNLLITSRYAPDNSPIRTPDKQTTQTQSQQSLQASLSACANKYVLSKQVSTCKEILISPLPNLYSELENRPFAPAVTKHPQDQSVDEWLADYEGVTTTEHASLNKPSFQPVAPIPQHISDWMKKMESDHHQRIDGTRLNESNFNPNISE